MRDESIGVDVLDQAEDFDRLALVGQDYQYLDVTFAVPACTVEHRYATMGFFGDAVGYLLVFFGEDEELYRLAGTVHNVVEHKADDEQRYKAEYHAAPVVEDEVARTDDWRR